MKSKIILFTLSLFFGSLFGTVFSQNKTITGIVSDKNGPMEWVSVGVVGTTTGVVTSKAGSYSINAPLGATLKFAYLGYEDHAEVVSRSNVIDVTMTEIAQLIDEFVVIGYGVQRKSDLTGSVASIKADELSTFPSSSVSEMLRGKAAGVSVTSSTGRPGSSPAILIRGKRSLTGGNEPLFIVDGTPIDKDGFASINNTDIQSIEILKDAAAQAIYGARAANGVVLVTTKRGNKGEVRIDFDAYLGEQRLWKNFDFYNGEEFYQLRKEAIRTEIGRMPVDVHEVLQDEIMEKAYANKQFTNWEDLMLKPALIQKYDMSVRGGGENTRIAAGFGFYDQVGMAPKSGYTRGNMRLNIDYDINKYISLGINSSFARYKTRIEDGRFNEYITRPPLGNPYDENGKYTPYINSSLDVNPLFAAENASREIVADNYKINTFIDVKPFAGFSYRLNASMYSNFAEEGNYRNKDYPGGGASGSLSNLKKDDYLIENIINYMIPIKHKDHRLNLTLVQSYDYELHKQMSYSASSVPVDFDWNMLLDGKITGIGREYIDRKLLSFMARTQYNFMERYLLTVSWRRDGSSVFGKSNKWGDFPSIALAWRIIDEPFMKMDRLSNLKLRISYGQVGNQAIAPYKTLGGTISQEMLFGNVLEVGYLPNSELSNPNLKWETTASANIGLDFGLFSDRLYGSVEYYNTTTTDLLVERSINSSLGYTTMYDNLGKTRTQGYDISLNADIIRQKELQWSVGVNYSYSQNEIIRINDKVDEFGKSVNDENMQWFVGHPIDVYYDYVFDGIYQYSDFDEIQNPNTGAISYVPKNIFDSDNDGIADKPLIRQDTYQPGSIKVKDVNNDGKIDAEDRSIIHRDPDFIASISTSLNYRGFDFFLDFYGVSGAKGMNLALNSGNYGGSLQGKLNGMKVNYWTPENPSNEFPRPIFNSNTLYFKTIAYQDASYLRLRTVSLGYTLPQKISMKAGMQRLRVYCTGTNLLTWTDFRSYSPEVMPGGNPEGINGTTPSGYPESQQFIFGLNVSF